LSGECYFLFRNVLSPNTIPSPWGDSMVLLQLLVLERVGQ